MLVLDVHKAQKTDAVPSLLRDKCKTDPVFVPFTYLTTENTKRLNRNNVVWAWSSINPRSKRMRLINDG